jgi:hypothetical protein
MPPRIKSGADYFLKDARFNPKATATEPLPILQAPLTDGLGAER